MKDWLYPGAKVVCVRGYSDPNVCGSLREGSVYTVREVGEHVEGGVGVKLVGIKFTAAPRAWLCSDGRIVRCNGDAFADASRFRPLTKRTTDITIFKAMLHDTHQKVDA